MEVTVEIKGLKELDARLVELGALASAKAVRAALRRSAAPFVRAAKANARGDDSGALAASIGVFNIKRLGGGDVVARVGIGPVKKSKVALYVHNAFYRRKRKGIYYGHMVEYGHRIGTRQGKLFRISRAQTGKGLARWQVKRSGGRIKGLDSSGTVGPRPFLRPAFNAEVTVALEAYRRDLHRAVKRIERRKGWRQANPDAGLLPGRPIV